ncbi:MAG: PUR family DNA/RNA-binding protein [Alteromonas sp.]|nr:PUR family DNA/RNA-binding protein [Alteromonas sp.]
MSQQSMMEQEEIYSKVMRAGRRTYFFDVRETKAGDYYLTITESKKFTNEDGSFHYKKHKIYLYKEDFADFKENLDEMIQYVLDEKGDEVISERHQKKITKGNLGTRKMRTFHETSETSSFTDVDFDDI